MQNKKKSIEILFTFFLLSIFFVFVFIAVTQYDRQTRSFPLFIGVIGLLLTAILFASYFIPFIGDKITSLKQKEIFEIEYEIDGDTRKIGENQQIFLSKELNIIIWLIVLLICLYFFGFLVVIPAFIFAFLKFREKENLFISIIIPLGTSGIIYILFVKLLRLQLFKGLFFM